MLKSGEKLQKLIMLLITWALLLAAFVVYQQYFVKGQESFFKKRAFRTLDRLSAELDHKFEEAQNSTESFVKLVKWDPEVDAAKFLGIYLKGLPSNDKDQYIQAAKQCWSHDLKQEHVPLESRQDRDGLTLSVYCFVRAAGDDPELPDPSQTKLLYALDLTDKIRDGLREQGSDFDDLLVADSNGHVVFQQSSAGPRIAYLKSLLTDNNAALPQKAAPSSADAQNNEGSPASPKVPEMDRLNDTSFFTDVTLAGESYKMFSQPVRISLHSDLPGRPPLQLVLAGLRPSSSFASETHALPYSSVIWAGLIIVALFNLSWPLFKLHYMSASERFTPKDGWFLIITILLAATSVILILLNASYGVQEKSQTDTHLRKLAEKIKKHFLNEMEQQRKQLQQLTDEVQPGVKAPKTRNSVLIPNYLDSSQSRHHPPPRDGYPYFEIASWMKSDGQQVLKFDVRSAPTPPINLKDQDIFKRVSGENQEAESKNAAGNFGNTYFQTLFSPSTDEFLAVMSASVPSESQKKSNLQVAVQALTSKPMSVVNPVLPPGYGFAVIDEACSVLFHSDSVRDGKENFCKESESAGELKPWLFSGIDNSLDISYAGHSERAYLTSLELPGTLSGQAFLIVFQEPERQLTLNLAIILVCSILLGTYAVALLLVAGIHLAIRRPLRWLYAPDFIWPCRDQAINYLQLAAAIGAMLLLFWILYPRLYEAPLLLLSVAVPLLSVLFALSKLRGCQKFLMVSALVLFGVGAVGLLLSCWPKATSWHDWCWVFLFLVVCGIVAYLLSGKSALPQRFILRILPQRDRLENLARGYFTACYVVVALAMITAAALVPTVGFFKYAYDAVSELALKHDQAEVADRVLARFDRIHDYYKEVKHPPDLESHRIDKNLDRYDKSESDGGQYDQDVATFIEKCEPQIRAGNSKNDCLKPTEDPIGFNQQIEKWVAGATLLFPANPLGSRMSKLGVAGNDPDRAWKRSWTEDPQNPRKFTLIWNKSSSMSGFSVESTYKPWQGLQWWAKLCLIPLSLVLGVWLIAVVKKIFLTEFEGALEHDPVAWKSISDIQKSALIIGPAKSGKTKWLREILGPPVGARHVAAAVGGRAPALVAPGMALPDAGEWRDLRSNLAETCPLQASVLVLDHFEFNLRDRQCNLERLKLLEDRLYNAECKVVLVSTVDPLFYLTEGAPEMLADKEDPAAAGRLLDRWARVLSKFTRVRLKDSDEQIFLDTTVANFNKKHGNCGKHMCCRQLGHWVAKECSHTSMLREIGAGILNQFKEGNLVTQELVVRNVLESADLYYHVLWSGMTLTERLVLYQLALDGWANPKNVAALQQLERKSLISRAPMYKIMNESFRRFIESAEHADEIAQWAKNERQSTWHALRIVAAAAAIGIVVWLVYTQAALSQALTGYVAGIATLLTAVTSLFGRSGKTPPKTEDKPA